MNATKTANLLWSWEVQCLANHHMSKVDRELIAPYREPFDIAQCLSFWQCQCDIFTSISFQHATATALITNSHRAFIVRCFCVANIEICCRTFAIVCESFNEQSSRVDGVDIARHRMMIFRQSADMRAIIVVGGDRNTSYNTGDETVKFIKMLCNIKKQPRRSRSSFLGQ